jgi:transcriptional regulator with XRE-family HTH domain
MQAYSFMNLILEDVGYNSDMAGRPPNKEAPPFGQRLALLRKAHGISQAQFAQLVGSTLKAIDYYERRAKNPTADFVQKAASVFGVSVDELLGIKPLRQTKPGPVSKLHQKIDQITHLPRSTQQYVLQFLDQVLAAVNQNGHKKAA